MYCRSTVFFSFLLGVCSFPAVAEAVSHKPDPWERQVVAACLILEAASEGPLGMTAVANVIENRAKSNPRAVYGVVKRPYAFSSMNSATTGKTGRRGFADHVRRASRDPEWRNALKIVDRLYNGTLTDLTGGATHFSLKGEYVAWMKDMRVTAIIGSHRFFAERS
jgi:spore germination cell wall hydrolase CwlJ-like protein